MSASLARLRVPLGFVLAAIVLYLATPNAVVLAVGLPLATVGLVFRAAAAGVIRKNTALAREGPYRLTRNPLYFGSFMLALGFAIMSGSLLAGMLLVVPFALIYPPVIRSEEAFLRDAFGPEFEQFRQTTPGFLPRTLSLRLFETFSMDRYLANREYNAGLGFIGATAVLWLKHTL